MLHGKELILSLITDIPTNPGIYKMIDANSTIIYIGKAKNLKNRIHSYANNKVNPKTAHMVQNIHQIEYIITNTEEEALLLEADNIKNFKPKYNILLKDDKSFPFIKLSLEQNFPRITKHRDKNITPRRGIFGPFASSQTIDENIKTIQGIFKIRTCSDTYFNNREKPCILYQLSKCSAPCVNKTTKEDYSQNIQETISFLNGNTSNLKNQLIEKMNIAATNFNYEQALILRDKINSINTIENKQNIVLSNSENADFISIIQHNNEYIIKVFIFINGRNNGVLDFYPKTNLDESIYSILETFLMKFYDNKNLPNCIYLNTTFDTEDKNQLIILNKVLNNKSNSKTSILQHQEIKSKEALQILEILNYNAQISIDKHIKDSIKWQDKFTQLQEFLQIHTPLSRIEIYDNSHLYGTFPLGAMVCAEVSGFNKKEYRTYNLKDDNIKTNDDYGILKHVLTRRFKNIKENPEKTPSLIIIDGGKGQLSSVMSIANKYDFSKNITIISVAKGENRNAGEETILFSNGGSVKPDKFSSVLHFIQHLRNEAHNFAINTVRKKKEKTISKSSLEDIPNIGKVRKQKLVQHFITVENIKNASIEQLEKVETINNHIAKQIFDYFNKID